MTPSTRGTPGTHLPDMLTVHGFSAAQRFRISDTQMNDNAIAHKSLATYEVDEEKLPAVRDALASAAGTDATHIDPALDMNATVAYVIQPDHGDGAGPGEREFRAACYALTLTGRL